ncbi:MAG: hypothetical protein IT385_21695 [Deltaproteobacteria bacterium]|nr:hypothetical protein [Deltaproteobacteria bacterium]
MHRGWLLLLCSLSLGCKGETSPAPPTSSPPPTTVAPTTVAPTNEDAGEATSADDAANLAPEPAEVVSAEPPPIVLAGTAATQGEMVDWVSCDGPLADPKTFYVSTPKGRVALLVRGPEGTQLSYHGKKLTLGKEPTPLELDVLDDLLDNGKGQYEAVDDNVNVDFLWTTPDGKNGSATLHCTVGSALAKLLSAVAKGPVRWPIEGEQRYKDDAAVVIREGIAELHAAYDSKLYNVDTIYLERRVTRKLSSCNYTIVDTQTGRPTGGSMSKERYAIDLVVDGYDRRTGRKIKSKTFRSENPECPQQIPTTDVRPEGGFADTGTFYYDIYKEHPEDGPAEHPMPVRTVEVELAGDGVPETKLPAVSVIEKRFLALGFKPAFEPMRSGPDDGEVTFSGFYDISETDNITIDVRDWSGTKTPKDEYSDPGVYAIGGRGALLVKAPASMAGNAMQVLVSRPLPDAVAVRDALAPLGWKADKPVEDSDKRTEEPGVQTWFVGLSRDGAGLALDYLDWGDVVDGKAPNAAVARSKDAFVVITSSVPGKAAEVLAKLVK